MTETQTFSVAAIFDAVDHKDAAGFAAFFADAAIFKMGNYPAAQGKDAIIGLSEGIFDALEGLGHEIVDTFEFEGRDVVIANGIVTYYRKDGVKKSYPFSSTFKLQPDGLIGNYQAYVDNHDLFA